MAYFGLGHTALERQLKLYTIRTSRVSTEFPPPPPTVRLPIVPPRRGTHRRSPTRESGPRGPARTALSWRPICSAPARIVYCLQQRPRGSCPVRAPGEAIQVWYPAALRLTRS